MNALDFAAKASYLGSALLLYLETGPSLGWWFPAVIA